MFWQEHGQTAISKSLDTRMERVVCLIEFIIWELKTYLSMVDFTLAFKRTLETKTILKNNN